MGTRALPKYQQFGWQEGYGAFSVSTSQMEKTIAYIQEQKEHHRRKTFQEEFRELLERHGIEYDRRYLFANQRTVTGNLELTPFRG